METSRLPVVPSQNGLPNGYPTGLFERKSAEGEVRTLPNGCPHPNGISGRFHARTGRRLTHAVVVGFPNGLPNGYQLLTFGYPPREIRCRRSRRVRSSIGLNARRGAPSCLFLCPRGAASDDRSTLRPEKKPSRKCGRHSPTPTLWFGGTSPRGTAGRASSRASYAERKPRDGRSSTPRKFFLPRWPEGAWSLASSGLASTAAMKWRGRLITSSRPRSAEPILPAMLFLAASPVTAARTRLRLPNGNGVSETRQRNNGGKLLP